MICEKMFFTRIRIIFKTLFHYHKKKGKLAKYNINRIKNFNIFFMVVIIIPWYEHIIYDI